MNQSSKFESIFLLIVDYLPITDLFNFRLINKKIKELCDQSNGINKLIIGQLKCYDNYWSFNNKQINEDELIAFQFYKHIRLLSIFNLDNNLKYLKINYYDKQFKLEETISNLSNLKVLEIEDALFGNQNINLNNLKFLFISNACLKSGCKFNLNTPKLEQIKFPNIDCINFISNLDSIKYLNTSNYDDELSMFKNVEFMQLNLTEDYLDSNLLNVFKQLKILKIFHLTNLTGIYNGIRDDFIYILKKRLNPFRDINIYFNGVKLENVDKFKEFESCKSVLEYQIKNFDLLDTNLDIKGLYYHQLEDCINDLPNNLSSKFFDKYSNLLTVNVTKVKDVKNLQWFLKKLPKLEELNLSNYLLDQNFYNNLPTTIKILIIDSNNANINYDFILNLNNLIQFSINDDIDLFDFAIKSFLELKYLKCFQFYFKDKEVEIYRSDNGFYDLAINSGMVKKKLNYIELEPLFNEIKSNTEYFSDDEF